MTTKEKIVYEALTLFSTKGYKGTSVKNIADAVGIKDSSLYKHFKSKEEILNTIMELVGNHIREMSINFGLGEGEDYKNVIEFYKTLDKDSFVEFIRKIFLFYLKDDLISKFWRLGLMEQFQNEKVYSLFREFFLEESIKYLTAIFAQMSRENMFIDADPQVMAISFYTPIFFLLSKYSGFEEKEEEVVEILDKQINEFYRIYSK